MKGLKHHKSIAIDSHLRLGFTLLLFSVLLARPASAQVKFTAVASSNEIGRADYVQIEYVVENAHQIEGITQPSFQDFRVVQGPIQSSGMSVVNGLTSQYQGLSFVLQPVRMGKFTIPGATATVDGKAMRSNSVTIVVGPNSTSGGSLQPLAVPAFGDDPMEVDREYLVKPGENVAEKIRKNIFVKVQVSKTDCYVGEPIVATYKLYSRLQSESRVSKHPSLNGFSVFDMVDPTKDQPTVENVNGKAFTVHVIRKAQLIPLIAGKIDLDPMEVDNTIHFLKSTSKHEAHPPGSLQELFDQFSAGGQEGTPFEQDVALESKPVSILVKALPEQNKPANFSGAVGHYSLEAAIENKNITAHDAAILKVTLKGDGNLPLVNAPGVDWPSGVESYDASAKEEIDKSVAPLSGTKTFEYSFIPKHAGDYLMPAVSFSYFDPQSSSYKTVESKPLNFLVASATKKTSLFAPFTAATQPVTGVASWVANFLRLHLEWLFAVLILSGVAIYLFMQNRRLKRGQSLAAPVSETAVAASAPGTESPLATSDPLARAKRFYEYNEYKNFYRELYRAIGMAVEDKLNLPGSEMNKTQMSLKLRERGWDEPTTTLLESILSECEIKLYSPAHSATDMQRILRESEKIIGALALV
jgi:hypothetical protein